MRQSAKLMAPLLALLMVVGSMASVVAQESSDEEILASLEGLEKFYTRAATLDFGAMTESSEAESGEAGSWIAMMTGVAEFDSEEHAAAGAALISENGAVQSMTGEGAVEPEAVELDLDFEHATLQASSEDDGVTYSIMQSVVQKGELVYLSMAWVMDRDPAEKVTSTIATLYDAEPSDDPETFNADGTSTGGLWAVLPTADDLTAGTEGLTLFEDSIEFPVQDGAGS